MLPFDPNGAAAVRLVRWPPKAMRPATRVRRALVLLSLWRERARQRRALAQLDAHILRDLGITREEALGEAAKPFWR